MRVVYQKKQNRYNILLAGCQTYKSSVLKSRMNEVLESSEPSDSFVSSKKPDDKIDMGHLQKNCAGQQREIIIADVFEKESLIQKTHVERRFTTTAAQIVGRKMKHTDKKNKQEHTHTQAKLERWDTTMGEELGENAACNQPYRLREKIHVGRLKIKQVEGHTLPVKQLPEYHLAVKNFKGREQQRVAGCNLRQEEPKANPSSSSSSQWDGWWTSSSVETNHGNGKNDSRSLLAKSWSASDDPPKVDTRAGSEHTLTAQNAFLFLHTTSLVESTAIC